MTTILAPIAAGLLTVLVSWWFEWSPSLPDRSSVLGFAGSVATVASTMLGFMLAALAILVSVSGSTLVQIMRRSGHYDDLLRTIFLGCALFLCIALGGFALLFGLAPGRGFLATLLGLHAAALVSLVDIGRKFRLVLVNLTPS